MDGDWPATVGAGVASVASAQRDGGQGFLWGSGTRSCASSPAKTLPDEGHRLHEEARLGAARLINAAVS